ncbi:MAG: GNAT family N-acetyltransferase [Saprospiraceae bacterium]
MKIIEANETHLEIVAELFDGYRVFYKQKSDIEGATTFIKERMQAQESIIFLAYDNEKAVGFTQLFPIFSSVSMERSYLLNDLYVLPECRGKQIGASLLRHAQAFIIKKGYKGLALETAIDNPAQKLYERLGWEKEISAFHYFWKNPK